MAQALGYDIAKKGRLEEADRSIHLAAVFACCAVDSAFDVGAQSGSFRDVLRDDVFFKGPIVSFEPAKKNRDILRRRMVEDKSWYLEECALGAAAGVQTLNIAHYDSFSSFLRPAIGAVPSMDFMAAVEGSEQVPVSTLAEMIDRYRARFDFKSLFVKIDTQGYDLEVLKGAGNELKRISALQIEGALVPIYEGMPMLSDMLEFLRAGGFTLTGLFPVVRDERLRIIEADCVFVRT